MKFASFCKAIYRPVHCSKQVHSCTHAQLVEKCTTRHTTWRLKSHLALTDIHTHLQEQQNCFQLKNYHQPAEVNNNNKSRKITLRIVNTNLSFLAREKPKTRSRAVYWTRTWLEILRLLDSFVLFVVRIGQRWNSKNAPCSAPLRRVSSPVVMCWVLREDQRILRHTGFMVIKKPS